MLKIDFEGHKIEVYSDIAEFPIDRHNELKKWEIYENNSFDDFGAQISKIIHLINSDSKTKAVNAVKNFYQSLYAVKEGFDSPQYQFACLIKRIDDNERDDFTEEGLEETLAILKEIGFTQGKLEEYLSDVKKN